MLSTISPMVKAATFGRAVMKAPVATPVRPIVMALRRETRSTRWPMNGDATRELGDRERDRHLGDRHVETTGDHRQEWRGEAVRHVDTSRATVTVVTSRRIGAG